MYPRLVPRLPPPQTFRVYVLRKFIASFVPRDEFRILETRDRTPSRRLPSSSERGALFTFKSELKDLPFSSFPGVPRSSASLGVSLRSQLSPFHFLLPPPTLRPVSLSHTLSLFIYLPSHYLSSLCYVFDSWKALTLCDFEIWLFFGGLLQETKKKLHYFPRHFCFIIYESENIFDAH